MGSLVQYGEAGGEVGGDGLPDPGPGLAGSGHDEMPGELTLGPEATAGQGAEILYDGFGDPPPWVEEGIFGSSLKVMVMLHGVVCPMV